MSSGLSKRERLFITAALIFVIIVAGVWFFIIPLRDNYEFLQAEYANQLTVKAEMEQKLSSEGTTRAELEIVGAEYEKLRERYPVNLSNTDIERILTELFRRNGMHVASFYMSGGSENTGGESSSPYSVVSVSSALEGYYSDLMRVLRAVEDTGYVRVTHVSFQSLTEINQISISLSVTSLNEGEADEAV